MSSLNQVNLIGNLGADPEVRHTQNNDPITNIRLAITERWRDKQTGEMREATEWVTVTFFGRQAEVAGEYLKKGSKVFVTGKLRTREYEKDGVKRYLTEVRADNMVLLDRKDQTQVNPQGSQRGQTQQRQAPKGKQAHPIPSRAVSTSNLGGQDGWWDEDQLTPSREDIPF